MATQPATRATSANGASAQQQAATAAMMLQQQKDQNRRFMALSINKEVLCQQANGGANSQAWAAGQPLTYNIASSNNGFLTGFWIRISGTSNPAVGTSAVYGATAGAPLTIFDSVQVLYGGKQHDLRPYELKYYSQLQAQGAQVQPRVLVGGQSDSTYQAYLNTAMSVATGSNTFQFAVFIPMNLIHAQDVRGILPIANGQSPVQVVINCAGALVGLDPVLNTWYPVSGTGHSVALAANVSVIAVYKDGQSYAQLDALQPNLSGMETVQYLRDTPLNAITAGQVMSGKVSYLHKIPWLFVTVIDGNQSNKFSATTNIQVIRTTTDQNGLKPFMAYGLNTNMNVMEFYTDLCGAMGGLLKQDLDEGFFPLIYGPLFQQADAGILEGMHYLNMTQGSGWTDFHYGFQLSTVGGQASVAGFPVITPRILVSAIILNDPLVM
jgi:hypothetical protein